MMHGHEKSRFNADRAADMTPAVVDASRRLLF